MPGIREAQQAVASVWRFLRPPRPGEDPEADYRWRMRVVFALFVLLALQIGHVYTADSWPWRGASARAQDAARIEAKLDTLIQQQTRTYVLTLAREICRLHFALQEPQPSVFVRQTLERAYEERQVEYRDLTSERYLVTECQPSTA